MRVPVFLLILANLMFFAWTQGLLGVSENPDALRLSQQLAADQVRVVGRDDPPGEASSAAAKSEKREQEACLLLSELPLAELDRVEALIKEKLPGLKVSRTEAAVGGNYWVFIPPLPNKLEAERKTTELKRLKVADYFVMQEPEASRFAISLGTFSTREAAEARLEELRGKGVRSAKSAEREAKGTTGSLDIRGAEDLIETLRQASAEWVPKAKPMSCKTPRSNAP